MKRLTVAVAALLGFMSIVDAQPTAPPQLTITTAPNVVFLGDSITALWNGPASVPETEALDGYPTWTKILSNYSIHAPVTTNNFAVGGFTTANVLSTVPAALARKPDICVVMVGRNDVSTDLTLNPPFLGLAVGDENTPGSSIFNLKQIFDQLQAGNCVVIAVKIISQTFSIWPAGAAAKALQINNWLAEQKLHRRGFYLVDNANTYDDQTNTTHWQPKSHYISTANNIHPAIWGAYAIGKAIATQINVLYPDWRLRTMNVDDVYDATNNPYGNLLTNGSFTGTGGSLAGTTNATGFLANSWTMSTASFQGATVVASKTTTTDGRPAQTLTVSGTANAGGVLEIRNTISLSNLSQGDRVQCSVDASWGTTTNLNLVAPVLLITEGGVTTFPGILSGSLTADAGDMLPTETSGGGGPVTTLSVPLYTPAHTIVATPTVFVFALRVGIGLIASPQTIAGAIQFASAACKKLPRTTP